MRLTLVNSSSRQLDLALADTGKGTRFIKLEHLTEVSGLVTWQQPTAQLRPLTLREVQITGFEWPIPHGRVFFGTPATLAMLNVDGELSLAGDAGIPLDGELFAATLDTEVVTVELADRRISCDFRFARIVLVQNEGVGHAAIGTVDARNLQTSLLGFFVRLDGLVASGSRAIWQPGRTAFESASMSLRTLIAQRKGLDFEADQIELPRGMTVADGAIHIGELVVGKATVAIEDVLGWDVAAGDAAPPPATTDVDVTTSTDEVATAPTTKLLFDLIDLRLLDLLAGQVDVDATVDATVPVIGRRRATHHFRVPVEDGTINYKELERDLATLEDAVIDFEVRDGRLVLERDVPVLPGLNKPLVIWELSDVELALAKKRIVRLHTLLGYAFPNAGGGKSRDKSTEKPSVVLRKLDCDNIDITLGIDEPALDQSPAAPTLAGAIPRISVGELHVSGALRYQRGQDPPPSELSITAAAINLALRNVDLGGARLDIGSVRIDAIESARLGFTGMRPNALLATIRGLRLTDVVISL